MSPKSRKSALGVPPRSEKNIESKKEQGALTPDLSFERFWRKNEPKMESKNQ